MSNRNRTPLSQARIDAMIQFGTEPFVLQGAAARREIARLRRDLGLTEPVDPADGARSSDETLGVHR